MITNKFVERTVGTLFVRRQRPTTSLWLQRQWLSSTSTKDDNKEKEEDGPPATLIQGPSLLVTSTSPLNRPSPSMFYMPGLRSLPFWTMPSSQSNTTTTATDDDDDSHRRVAFRDPTVIKVIQHLESNYHIIKEEYMAAVMGIRSSSQEEVLPKPLEPDYDVNVQGSEHAQDSLHTGTWDWHSYIIQGEFKEETFAKSCPQTARIVKELSHLFVGTPFGFCFFSTLQPQSTIQRHAAPMNIRLRCHLPLLVPSGGKNCGIRVGNQVQSWQPGKVMVLDDSYPHEVWNHTTDETRVIFLLDIWHPDVTKQERHDITQMFQYAKGQGWIGKEETEETK